MYLHLAKRTRAARPLTNESQTSERVRIRTNMSMSGAARSAPCTRLRSSDVNEKCVRLDGSDVSQLRARDVESSELSAIASVATSVGRRTAARSSSRAASETWKQNHKNRLHYSSNITDLDLPFLARASHERPVDTHLLSEKLGSVERAHRCLRLREGVVLDESVALHNRQSHQLETSH